MSSLRHNQAQYGGSDMPEMSLISPRFLPDITIITYDWCLQLWWEKWPMMVESVIIFICGWSPSFLSLAEDLFLADRFNHDVYWVNKSFEWMSGESCDRGDGRLPGLIVQSSIIPSVILMMKFLHSGAKWLLRGGWDSRRQRFRAITSLLNEWILERRIVEILSWEVVSVGREEVCRKWNDDGCLEEGVMKDWESGMRFREVSYGWETLY